MSGPVKGCGNRTQFTTDQHAGLINAELKVVSSYDYDGMVSGYAESYFASVAISGLVRFQDIRDVCETLRTTDVAGSIELLGGTSAGIRITPQDTRLLKGAMQDYIAHLRQQTEGLCTNIQLQSALYFYGELQQATDKGLYVSTHTQSFFPPAATPNAQAWLRCSGYLGMEEDIESLTSGAIIHFSAPAKGKPMLILYIDNGHKVKKIQQGLYDEFLKWHSRGVKHVLLECISFVPVTQEQKHKKKICSGEEQTFHPDVEFYCAFDDVFICGVDDGEMCSICNPCGPAGDRTYLAFWYHRDRLMVDLIERAAEEFCREIALFKVGTAHVQHLIDELPTRGIGLMVIEIPQSYEHYKDFMETSKRIQEKCDEMERQKKACE